MKYPRIKIIWLVSIIILSVTSFIVCRTRYLTIDKDTKGSLEIINNIANMSIVSKNVNDYKAEYNAGLLQGTLQKNEIRAARNNTWQGAYLTDPTHEFPTEIPPSKREIKWAQQILKQNLRYTLNYIKNTPNQQLHHNMQRLMYRLIGIYHGATSKKGQKIRFNNTWQPIFSDHELSLGYGENPLTFLDIYFINAFIDLSYFTENPACSTNNNLEKCSAFVKKSSNDIFITHNTWYPYLSQTMALTLYINGDYLCVNALWPGLISSSSDFGYNNKGIIFNETTVNSSNTKPKIDSLWMFWRAALAQQFATSLDEFYEYASLEASGTFLNGYIIVDTKTNEIGLVEMSCQSFIYFKSTGSDYTVITKPQGLSTEYDHEMVNQDYIFGINYPASLHIRNELQSKNTRPARTTQFLTHIQSVNDIESAKALITYIDPANPLSIYGRWDLGYGQTPTPKAIPAGAIDAKAVSASSIKYIKQLKGTFDPNARTKIFWMKFGTPAVNGKPFIWSESPWRGWPLSSVPDKLEGPYTELTVPIS